MVFIVKKRNSIKLQGDKFNLKFSVILRKKKEKKEEISKHSKTNGTSVPSLQP